MAKQSNKGNPFVGRWRIVSMSAWEDNCLNEEGQAFIEFDAGGRGSLQFGYVQGQFGYRTKKRDGKRAVQFTWDGEDGADGTPLEGIGWANLEGDELNGMICIHLGEDSEFVANRVSENDGGKRGSERHMAKEHPRLKLGKRASFVKTRLKELPQPKETWEADFRAMPKPMGETETHYLGVAVALPSGDPLVYMPMECTPNVNDLADLLAAAMRRPLTGSARRPTHLHFRGNPRWAELYRHLEDIGIETSIHDELPSVVEVYEDFLRQMRKATPGPVIMLSPGQKRIDQQFPAIAWWVQESGWIEVGQQEDAGFVVRALNDGGVVFEDEQAETLAEAMTALETGLRQWFKEQCIEVG